MGNYAWIYVCFRNYHITVNEDKYAFSKDGKKTIESYGYEIGKDWSLSIGDIETLQYLYGGKLELGHNSLPKGFADVDWDGRADFYRFVGGSSKP